MNYLLDAICRTGTYCQTWCEWCDRTHFLDAPDYHGDYEEGELEELHKKNEKDPDKYIVHYKCDAIGHGEFLGKQIVHGCPCNEKSLQGYVDHYWSHRRILAAFLKAKAKAEASTIRARAVMLDAIGEKAEKAGDYIDYPHITIK